MKRGQGQALPERGCENVQRLMPWKQRASEFTDTSKPPASLLERLSRSQRSRCHRRFPAAKINAFETRQSKNHEVFLKKVRLRNTFEYNDILHIVVKVVN